MYKYIIKAISFLKRIASNEYSENNKDETKMCVLNTINLTTHYLTPDQWTIGHRVKNFVFVFLCGMCVLFIFFFCFFVCFIETFPYVPGFCACACAHKPTVRLHIERDNSKSYFSNAEKGKEVEKKWQQQRQQQQKDIYKAQSKRARARIQQQPISYATKMM